MSRLPLKNYPLLIVPLVPKPWVWTLLGSRLNLRSLRPNLSSFRQRTMRRHLKSPACTDETVTLKPFLDNKNVIAGVPEPGLRGGVQVPMAKAFVGSNPTPRTCTRFARTPMPRLFSYQLGRQRERGFHGKHIF